MGASYDCFLQVAHKVIHRVCGLGENIRYSLSLDAMLQVGTEELAQAKLAS
jgi:hypothetical protein